ncbi:MAG: arginyltransferase [Aeromonadaceae bacterium]|nr:arginyltransferase [Aeromonadaceae bacterium]
MTEIALRIGLTPEHGCSYLPDEAEQLMVLLDDKHRNPVGYENLLVAGFRRSGNDLYRPHCQGCSACHSLRIPVRQFTASRSQKRIQHNNRDIRLVLSTQDKPEYYDLFARYIHERHHDGSMFPATRNQYDGFLLCDWLTPYFLEFRLNQQLVALAITDPLPHSLSAMYTFFDPAFAERSLGTLAILAQLELAQRMNRQWLYLGYQVDACRKMKYKTKFHPHELLCGHEWKSSSGNEE